MASVRGTPWWFTTGGAWPSPVQSDLVRCGNHRSHTGGRLERRESAQETTKCCFLEAIILLHMLHKETIDYFLAARMFVDSSTVTPTVPFSDGVWRCAGARFIWTGPKHTESDNVDKQQSVLLTVLLGRGNTEKSRRNITLDTNSPTITRYELK